MKKVNLKLLLIVLITFIVCYFILKDDFNSIINVLLSSNYIYVLIAGLVILLGDIAKSISFCNIVNESNIKYSGKNSLLLMLETNFFNGITPFSLGGQPFQLYILKKKDNIDYSIGANILFKDFYVYQLAFLLVGFIFIILNLIFNFIELSNVALNMLIIGFLINVVIAIVLIIFPFIKLNSNKFSNRIIKILNKFKIVNDFDLAQAKLEKSINEFEYNISTINNNISLILKCTILNALKLLSLGLCLYFCIIATGNKLNLILPLIISIFVSTMSAFIPIPGASGGVEFSFVLLLSLFFANENVVAILLLWRLLTYYLPLIVGGVLFAIGDDKNENRNI